MAKKFRAGVIASGRIARSHGQGWTECNRTEIVAIADSHPEALESYAQDFNVKPISRLPGDDGKGGFGHRQRLLMESATR